MTLNNKNNVNTNGKDGDDWFQTKPPTRTREEIDFQKSWQLSISIACVILGIIIALLFKTYRKEGSLPTFYTQSEGLAKMVKFLEQERNKLQTDLAAARKSLSEYENSVVKGKDESLTLKNQLLKARQEAGLTWLKGTGIIVRLEDSPYIPRPDDDPNYYIIHDIDLSALVNELWASGAEAISINGERIVMTTAIRCVGPTITVNSVRLSPPYIVKALGPSSTMETGLKYTGGFIDSMSPNIDRGVSIKISKEKELIVPAFKGSLVHRYSHIYEPTAEEENK